MYKIISPVEAKKIMDSETDIAIIDVREEDELYEGYIENSILVPLDRVESEIEDKVSDKNKKILVYCRSGKRSAVACNIMDSMGYKNIYDFGGIIDWPFEKIL
ncbi:MAG: rhodanese-like domain-containing protein [Clostridia bacterium]|nr:rhodanese-like domain-containing protein [Clostridia bacterium]